VALVGGSFAPVGGHNPHEPLAPRCAVLHGPNVWNFSESYERLDSLGQSQYIRDVDEVVRSVTAVWATQREPDAAALVDPQAEAVISRVLDHLPS